MSDNARSLALVNMAISDALVASFHAKYEYNFWRPETAIHMGQTDGNPATEGDASFIPLVVTPCFPGYPSAHATLSGAVSGSSLREPSSTLRRRSGMWRSGPASAIGARLRRNVSPLSV